MASPVILLKERKCHFCKIKENNKLKYGPLYELNRIVAHYYCVLCSTRMKQNGKDNEGIMGFLLHDINLELRRSKKISCAYCPEKNATVECAYPGCKKIFHFPCGLEKGAISRFRNDFASFCSKHRPKQKIPKKILEEAANTELICAICYEEVDSTNRKDNLWAPCCLRTWYHRNCVQTLAHSSGYFFRCATCNDAGKFKSHMEDNGIFVPQQDASWELVPNAYEELLVRHNRCDAEECKCPNGREDNVEDTRWEIILCRFCGSQGIHVGCGDLKFTDPEWECSTCQSIMKTDSKSTKDEEGEEEKEEKEEKEKEEMKGDLPVKKSSPKSNDQPETAPRKRKLSVQSKSTNKRKKEKVEGEKPTDDNNDEDSDAEENRSGDEFYIKLPGRKNDKPHTATKPDEESDEEVDVISVDTAWLMVEEVLSRVKPGPLSYKLRFLRKKVFSYQFDPFDIREEIETIDLASDSEDNSSVLVLDKKSDTDSDIEFIGEVKDSNNKEKSKQESIKMEPHEEMQPSPEQPDLAEGPVPPDVPELSDTETEVSEILEGARGSEGSPAADEPMLSDVSQEARREFYEAEDPERVQYVEFPEFPEVRPSTSRAKTEYERRLEAAQGNMDPYDDDVTEYFCERNDNGHVEYQVQEEKSDDDDTLQEELDRRARIEQEELERRARIEREEMERRARIEREEMERRARIEQEDLERRARIQQEEFERQIAIEEEETERRIRIEDEDIERRVRIGQEEMQRQFRIEQEDIQRQISIQLEGIERQVGRKHPASGVEYYCSGKRARTTATTGDIRAVEGSSQCQVPAQNLPPTAPLDSQQVPTSDPSSNIVYTVEQTFDNNQGVKTINLSIMDQSGVSTMLLPNTSYLLIDYVNNGGQTVLNASVAPSTSTTIICEPSTSGMSASLPATPGIGTSFQSTSEIIASFPSTSEMTASFQSTSEMTASFQSTSEMTASFQSTSDMTASFQSTSEMTASFQPGMATSLPTTPVMEASLPSTSGMPLSVASTSGLATSLPSLSGRQDESRSLTPLPSFQFLSNLHTSMSPLPSSGSSNSVSLSLSQRVVQPTENSPSSEGSNDGFPGDDNLSQKSAP